MSKQPLLDLNINTMNALSIYKMSCCPGTNFIHDSPLLNFITSTKQNLC
jgi:hypothetical protein